MTDPVAVLEQLPGLRGVDRAVLADLAVHVRLRSWQNEVICREDDAADRLWILASGAAEVVKRSESGREFVVSTLTPVCLFGHVGLFTTSGRTATIRARGYVEALQMTSTQAHLVLRTSPPAVSSPFRRALIIALSQQLTAATQTLWRLAEEIGATESVAPEEAERRLLEAAGKV